MSKKQPNILFLFSDQHRGQAMSCCGDENIKTTNMDRLAEEGVLFTNAYSNSPLCTPARGCLYTGQYATTHGAISNHYPLLPKQPQLAEVLKDNGYHTSHLGKWHLCGGSVGQSFCSPYFRPGWDEWIGWETAGHYGGEGSYFDTRYSKGSSIKIHHTNAYQADWLADKTIDWLEKQSEDQPWFHVVSFETPHGPHQCPEPYMDMYKDREIKYRPNIDMDVVKSEGVEHGLRGHYPMIKNLDDNIGHILNQLETQGILDDTIVFYFSDHGNMLGSNGLGGKCLPEEESIKIPLIVRYPQEIPKGTIADGLISLVDLMPTLLGFLGIPIPKTVEGEDFSDVLKGASTQGAESIYFQYEGFGYPPYMHGPAKWRGIRHGCWSFAYCEKDGPVKLYNLDQDPYQMSNLINNPEYEAVKTELLNKIKSKALELKDRFFTVNILLNERSAR